MFLATCVSEAEVEKLQEKFWPLFANRQRHERQLDKVHQKFQLKTNVIKHKGYQMQRSSNGNVIKSNRLQKESIFKPPNENLS